MAGELGCDIRPPPQGLENFGLNSSVLYPTNKLLSNFLQGSACIKGIGQTFEVELKCSSNNCTPRYLKTKLYIKMGLQWYTGSLQEGLNPKFHKEILKDEGMGAPWSAQNER